MNLVVVLTTFVLIFPAELPDKTFVATLVLSTRYPQVPVWCGVVAAFFVQCLVAVTAGGLLSLLPQRLVLGFTAALFAVGSVVLFRSAAAESSDADSDSDEDEEAEYAARATTPARGFRAAAISFAVLFTAEWGDLSQLLTAGLAARYEDPVSVFLGSWVALACVAAIAVLIGRTLLRFVRPAVVKRVAGTLFAVLAVLTGLEALGVQPPWE